MLIPRSSNLMLPEVLLVNCKGFVQSCKYSPGVYYPQHDVALIVETKESARDLRVVGDGFQPYRHVCGASRTQ